MQQDNKQTTGKPMVVSIKSIRSEGSGNGTGFFVTENLIATNIHCIAGASSVSAKHIDSNTVFDVEGVAAYDAKNDLVILKTTDTSEKGVPFTIDDSKIIEKGEFVQAVGCIDVNQVTTKGNYHNTFNKGQWLKVKAITEDGYSGGPLLNSKGKVIGINFLGGDFYSNAISSNNLKKLLDRPHTIESLVQWQQRKQIKAYDYLVQNKTRIEREDYSCALDLLDIAIQLDQDCVFAYIKRGEVKQSIASSLMVNGNLCKTRDLLQSAIDDFTNVIKTVPDHVVANNNRTDAKLNLGKTEVKMGNAKIGHDLYQAAMIDINSVIDQSEDIPIEENPDLALCYHTRGEIKDAIGDLHGAIEDLEESHKNTEYVDNSKVSKDLKRIKEAFTKQG